MENPMFLGRKIKNERKENPTPPRNHLTMWDRGQIKGIRNKCDFKPTTYDQILRESDLVGQNKKYPFGYDFVKSFCFH